MAGGQEGQEDTGHLQGLHMASDAHDQPGDSWGQERRPGRKNGSELGSEQAASPLGRGTGLERGQREEQVLGPPTWPVSGQHVPGKPGALILLKTEAPVQACEKRSPGSQPQALPQPQPRAS